MKLHETGRKGNRDRKAALQKYIGLCTFFHVRKLKDKEIVKLTNTELYKLGEDIYNRQNSKRRAKYCEAIGVIDPNTGGPYRIKPLAFKWYRRDLLIYMRATGLRWWWFTLTSPFRYPGFLKRKRERAKEEAAMCEEARVLVDAHKGMTFKEALAKVRKAHEEVAARAKIIEQYPDEKIEKAIGAGA